MTNRRCCNIILSNVSLNDSSANQSEHAAERQREQEGERGSYAELILPSGEIPLTAHSSNPIMVVPQPNI